ncbi:Copper-transporting ATPase 1 (Fragment) [Seminavis robusta]|uniref:Copper-transporting ATPase 1 n=1 Tax=Seminavis robusta TaxID=568900 RepID=A0A9N8DNR1_9STRA
MSESNATTGTTTVWLTVEGMMCQRNCGSTVENALRGVPGVLDAKASFATSSAWATLAAGTNASDVVEAVEDVGFDASLKTTRKIYCQVEGMMCQRNCGSTVQNALLQTEGVLSAEASFRHSQAWAEVAINNNNNNNSMEQEVVDAIECVGFDAALLSEEEALQQQKENDNQQPSNPTPLLQQEIEESSPNSDNPNVIILSVEGMSCAVCTGKVERCLLKVPGVATAFVSLATHRAEITFNHVDEDGIEQLAQEAQQHVEKLGYPSQVLSAGGGNSMTLEDNAKTLENAKHSELVAWRNLLILAVSLLIPMLWLKRSMAHMKLHAMKMDHHGPTISHGNEQEEGDLFHNSNNNYTITTEQLNNNNTTSMELLDEDAPMAPINYHLSTTCGQYMLAMAILAILSQTLVGYRYYRAAWHAGRDFGMDFLVVLGTTANLVYSLCVWFWLLVEAHAAVAPDNTALEPTFGTGTMLLTFVTFGKFLEAYAKGKTSSALEALMKLQPSWASRVVKGMEGWQDTTIVSDRASMPIEEEPPQPLQLSALETEEVSAWDVRIGDYLRVLPGARIPADGVIVALSSSSSSSGKTLNDAPSKQQTQQAVAYIDESAFSGEPFPVPKSIGESVYGSSVNQLSVLVIRVTACGSNSVLAKIVRLMEDAQRQKAPIQALADRIASIFAPAVMGLAAMTFLFWVVLDCDADTNQERLVMAFLSAISVIVVACPCALGLATPTAVMVGTGVGASQGLLIKGGSVLEEMQGIDTFVFDKTGTLTTGKAVLGEHRELVQDPQDPLLQHLPSKVLSRSAPKNSKGEQKGHNLALWLASCAEQQSEHPLAKAVVNAAKSQWGGNVTCSHEGVTVEDFSVTPGSGVECVVSKPHWGTFTVRVGNKQWAQETVQSGALVSSKDTTGDQEIAELRRLGQIGVYVSVLESEAMPDLLSSSPVKTGQRQRRVVGVLGIVDPIREQAKSTVAALQKLGIDVFLLTGDHVTTAKAVARQVGIKEENVCAGVKPEEKAEYVTKLQARRGWSSEAVRNRGGETSEGACSRVGFVGDGINDSIALARANVGVAIGAGTEVAVEAADIVLVRSNLHDVVIALHLSRVVFRRIRMNFIWAMAYNLLALPFAAGILYPFTHFCLPPEYAGLMMAFSSVSVVTSSLLLRNYTRPSILEDGTLEGGSGLLQVLMHPCDRQRPSSRNAAVWKSLHEYQTVHDDEADHELELV